MAQTEMSRLDRKTERFLISLPEHDRAQECAATRVPPRHSWATALSRWRAVHSRCSLSSLTHRGCGCEEQTNPQHQGRLWPLPRHDGECLLELVRGPHGLHRDHTAAFRELHITATCGADAARAPLRTDPLRGATNPPSRAHLSSYSAFAAARQGRLASGSFGPRQRFRRARFRGATTRRPPSQPPGTPRHGSALHTGSGWEGAWRSAHPAEIVTLIVALGASVATDRVWRSGWWPRPHLRARRARVARRHLPRCLRADARSLARTARRNPGSLRQRP